MGKQSSRMYYKGYDHKDIFYQGHYHDAMYKGSELIWHKIRQEGYYSIILFEPTEKNIHETLILIFDENKGEFEVVLDMIPNPESPAYYVGSYGSCDGNNFYISTLGEKDVIGKSIDGINWGNTDLESATTQHQNALLTPNYFNDYMWGISTNESLKYIIIKYFINNNDNEYSIETKIVNTGFNFTRGVEKRLIRPESRKSRIALYHNLSQTGGASSTNPFDGRYSLFLSYYDVEEEKSGFIAGVHDNDVSIPSTLYYLNGKYIFFVKTKTCISGDTYSNAKYIYSTYMYYSDDGLNYNVTKIWNGNNESQYPFGGCYRSGMYYFYFPGYSVSIGSVLHKEENRVLTTSDFNHFSFKTIKEEIEINGNKYNPSTLLPIENLSKLPQIIEYFYGGERTYPEDGMICLYSTAAKKQIVYIDNMFYRESLSNRVFKIY